MLDGKKITAKIKVTRKRKEFESQYTAIEFQPDYDDDRNKEWAYATPSLYLSMNVIPDVARLFVEQQKFTMTLEVTPENEGSDNEEHKEPKDD